MFIDEMRSAFLCLRKRASVILNSIRLVRNFYFCINTQNFKMGVANIPRINEDAVNFVQERLMLNKTDNDAEIFLIEKILESEKSIYPKINFIVHTIAQGKGNLWKLFFGSDLTDLDHMPFNKKDCSKESDGEIENVCIQKEPKSIITDEGAKVYVSRIFSI
jgi:hypothetical protein